MSIRNLWISHQTVGQQQWNNVSRMLEEYTSKQEYSIQKNVSIINKGETRNNTPKSQGFQNNSNASVLYQCQFLCCLLSSSGRKLNNLSCVFSPDFVNCGYLKMKCVWVDGLMAGFSLSWGNSVCIIKL